MVGGIAGERLKSFIERIERLEEEKTRARRGHQGSLFRGQGRRLRRQDHAPDHPDPQNGPGRPRRAGSAARHLSCARSACGRERSAAKRAASLAGRSWMPEGVERAAAAARTTAAYDDLREFIERGERHGRRAVADQGRRLANLEMGDARRDHLSDQERRTRPPSFRGHSRLSEGHARPRRRHQFVEAAGADLGLCRSRSGPLDVVRAYRDRMKTHAPIPPRMVATGPVLENVDRDEPSTCCKFPGAASCTSIDGGRYIGTARSRRHARSRERLGQCRDLSLDGAATRTRVGLWMSPGKQGRQIRDKYFKAGKPCPVLICCGQDPLLFLGERQRAQIRAVGIRLRRRAPRRAL